MNSAMPSSVGYSKKSLFASQSPIEKPEWGTDEFKKLPDRRIRKKLRILETSVRLQMEPKIAGECAPPAFSSELTDGDQKPWQPVSMQGITVTDSKNLSVDFTFTSGSENLSRQRSYYEYRSLTNFFLTSIAVDQDKQWAATNAEMPEDIRHTALGVELLRQAQAFNCLVNCAFDRSIASGEAFFTDICRRESSPRGRR